MRLLEIFLLLSSVFVVGAAQETQLRRLNDRGIPVPDFRYVPWTDLEEDLQTDAANLLGYTEETWNVPFTASIEYLSYSTINASNPVQFDVLLDIGFFDEDQYDCYMNHYEDYFWFELVEVNVSGYFEALGWSQGSWEGDMPPPQTDTAEWFALTEEEQSAAENICYFAELWSMVPIPEWGLLETTPQDISGVNTDNNTSTTSTTTDSSTPPVDNVATLEQPTNRFILWRDLSSELQTIALDMGYFESTWNNILEAQVELKSYADLTETERVAAEELGFGPAERYDCWIHHYDDYSWTQLEAAGVQGYWITLGWTLESWQGLVEGPSEEDSAYEVLTAEQQEATRQLCFLPETWDKLPFEEWVTPIQDGDEEQSASESSSSSSNSSEAMAMGSSGVAAGSVLFSSVLAVLVV